MYFDDLKNNLLIKAALGEITPRPPVWLMRQAGRVLPEYLKIRERFKDFKSFVKNPDAAAEVTVQPVDILGVDAAIVFSDILVLPEAMGIDYVMEEIKGPVIPKTILNEKDIDALSVDVEKKLNYVIETIQKSKQLLQKRVPLIGFAGAPWTIFCYIIEGSGTKTFTKPRIWLYQKPELAHKLLQKITDATKKYLLAQVKAGVNVIQIFDSWAGVLGEEMYQNFGLTYIAQLCDELSPHVPVIVFSKGANFSLHAISQTSCSVVGIDWCIKPSEAKKQIKNKTIQGNLDPCALFAPKNYIQKKTKELIESFSDVPYIVNLGHGLYPETPKENVKFFVDLIKNFVSINY